MSGPVPTQDLLGQYTAEHQERIFRIAEAFSTDESKRRDSIVASSVKVAERSQWITPVTVFVAFGFALGSYGLFQNVVLSGLFLSVPVLRVLGSGVATIVRSRRGRDSEDTSD